MAVLDKSQMKVPTATTQIWVRAWALGRLQPHPRASRMWISPGGAALLPLCWGRPSKEAEDAQRRGWGKEEEKQPRCAAEGRDQSLLDL